MEIYNIENLNFSYPETKEKTLRNVSLNIERGEFVVISGMSGCGKSTLLRHLKTCLQPYGERSGSILFEGESLENIDFRTQTQKIGYVMQSPDEQSVTDKVWRELSFGLESLGIDSPTIQRRTAEISLFFGIEKLFDMNICELSGGQKQIVNLASVMIMQPSVLILDEPTAMLDPIATGEFISILGRINRELGTTVIMSAHNLDDIYPLCSRIAVMSNGQIISDGTPSDISRMLYEDKNEMFYAIPSPVRVFEYADSKNPKTPLSVSDAAKWLADYSEKIVPRPLPEEQRTVRKEDTLLELKNVWFGYDNGTDNIIKGLSFKAYGGELLAVLGGNGAGKTTMLSLISGVNKPCRGKIEVCTKSRASQKKGTGASIAVLPQDPKVLFVRDTVNDELYEMFDGTKTDAEEINKRIKSVVDLCGLENLENRNPCDLSGGELQKAALAKILLLDPEILLLDEPTKGLDAYCKKQFASILKRLTDKGKAVVMVSHDIEFCADYSDRCAFFFNGQIISEDTPKKFFCGNKIYTTPCRYMSQGIIEGAVTENDVLYALGIEPECYEIDDDEENSKTDVDFSLPEHKEESPKKHSKLLKYTVSFFSLCVFVVSALSAFGAVYVPYLSENVMFGYVLMLFSFLAAVSAFGKGNRRIKIMKSNRPFKYTAVSLIFILVTVPLTIMAGILFFDNTKYLFISLLIMLESILPFYIIFERYGMKARELVLIASMCSICTAGRVLLYMLPQFKPVTALVIMFGASFGSETGFLVGSATMLISNIFFGQGPWTPWQMTAMGAVGLLSGLAFERGLLPPNKIIITVFGFICSYLYGAVMNISTLMLSGTYVNIESILSVCAYGLPMDTVHAVSTALFLYVGAEPIIEKIERIKQKYGLIRVFLKKSK